MLFGSLICSADWHQISEEIQDQYEEGQQDIEISITLENEKNDKKVACDDENYFKIDHMEGSNDSLPFDVA